MTKKYEFVSGDEKTIAPGRTIKRIRAVIAIASFGVAPGSLGGYVEHDGQLSHSGDAWVFDDARVSGDAQVYGNARVSGDALVYGNSRVSGNAWVYGNARVYGNAQVYGYAQVYGDALVYGNARVSGDAWVYGNARVSGDAQVYGYAQVYGDAWVSDDARVSGDAWVSDDGFIFWASKVGTQNGTLTVYNTAGGELEVTRGCFRGSVGEFIAASKAKHDDQTHQEYKLLIEVAQSRISRTQAAIAKATGETK